VAHPSHPLDRRKYERPLLNQTVGAVHTTLLLFSSLPDGELELKPSIT
jgi:hypothetical protein